MKLLTMAALTASLAIAGSANAAVNLVTNGSFETGSFAWTVTGSAGDNNPASIIITDGIGRPYPTGAYGEGVPADNAAGSASPDAAGTHAAYFVSDFSSETLSQSVMLAPGQYRVGFDAYVPRNGLNNAGDGLFTGTVGGQNLVFASVRALPATQWTYFSTDFTILSPMTELTAFSFSTNFRPSDDIVIDRVFITAVTVPEPTSWALMLVGFGGLGAVLRTRRRQAVATA